MCGVNGRSGNRNGSRPETNERKKRMKDYIINTAAAVAVVVTVVAAANVYGPLGYATALIAVAAIIAGAINRKEVEA